jgi:hypothetical protein
MKRYSLAGCAVAIVAAAPTMAQQKTVKIGFISSFSGPVAAIGNDMRNSFELGLGAAARLLKDVWIPPFQVRGLARDARHRALHEQKRK